MKIRKKQEQLWFVVIALIILGAIGYVISQKKPSDITVSDRERQAHDQNLYPVTSFSHAHGLALDVSDSNKLYIATHEGLFLLRNESDLYKIGKSKDDFMGFSVHLTEVDTFYSSGHSRSGGNLGVQKSEDGGVTWKKISNGAGGPVDFHAMTISPVNRNILYGWYGGVQKSIDGGKTWATLRVSLPDVIAFSADSKNERGIFAATAQGLFGSADGGETWKSVSPQLEKTSVTVFALDPNDSQVALSYSQNVGLARSEDSGITWKSISGINDLIFHIAFDKNTSKKAYLLTKSHSFYKTLDGGITWEKIR